MRSVRRVGGIARRWALLAVLLVAWELLTQAARSPFFPPPTEIARTGAQLWLSGPPSRLFLSDTVLEHILPSTGRMLGGWAVAAILGIGAGLWLGRSPVAMSYVGGLLNFFRAIPPPLLVPFFLVTLGLSHMSFGTIIFGTMWPILLNTVDGARTVDSMKVDTARAFRLSAPQWILGVVLPAALPKVFAGLRLSLSMALILMVVSELTGSTNGIGNQLVLAQRDYDQPEMWAWIVLLGILGYLFNTVLLMVERRALRTRQLTSVGG